MEYRYGQPPHRVVLYVAPAELYALHMVMTSIARSVFMCMHHGPLAPSGPLGAEGTRTYLPSPALHALLGLFDSVAVHVYHVHVLQSALH